MNRTNRELLDILLAEQQDSWQRGNRVLVEAYLERHPVLRSDPEGTLDLIYNEIDARARQGETPRLDEYLDRFPQFASQIRDLFRVHRALEPSQATGSFLSEFQHGTDLSSYQGTTVKASDLPVIPGYEIERALGYGGMGVVYKARQVRPDRTVAIKMISNRSHVRPNELTRFRREAEAVARLQHPNIVQVFEVNDYNGWPYFSMEFVDGSNLATRMSGTPQPARQAAALMEVLARAMHYAHQRGIVHRDLKPANVLLPGYSNIPVGHGTPKITDFGLAKDLDQEVGQTQSGDLVGTPSYMAPEQAEGQIKAIGPATDVYGLGAVLYELLTGRPPFKGETALDTLEQVRSEEPIHLRRLQPKLPRDLETICLKCLQKEARHRYASAQALAEDLRRFLSGESILARPVGGWERGVKWARRRPAVAGLLAALIVVVVGGLLGMAALWQRAEQQWIAAETAKTRAEEQRKEVEAAAYVRFGEDLLEDRDPLGAIPCFARASQLEPRGPTQEIHLPRLTTFLRQCPRLLQIWPHPTSVNCASFSPDGRWVAACASSTVRIWEVATGKRLVFLEFGKETNEEIHQVAFSPASEADRLVIAASQGQVIRVWNQVTGKTATLAPPLNPKGVGTRTGVHVAFSPDGRQVVNSGGDRSARVWSIETAKPAWVLSPDQPVNQAVFSPNGRWIATAGQDGSAILWDVKTGIMTKTLKHNRAVLDIEFSPDSRWLVTVSTDRTTRVWDVNTGKLVTPMAHGRSVRQVAFSRDGFRVLTNAEDCQVGVWDARTGQLLTSLVHGHMVSGAAFSPDGRYIVTGSEDHTVAVRDLMKGEFLIPSLKHSGAVRCVAFSPDGRCILTAGDDGTVRLWDIQPAYRADPALRHPGMVHFATFSPDGRLIVTACDDGQAHIWDAASGRPICQPLRHEAPVLQATFSQDGQKVVTVSKDKTARIWQVNGTPVTPPLKHSVGVLAASLSPDGNSVITACADQTAWVWDVAKGQPRFSPPRARVPPPLPFSLYKAPVSPLPGMPIEPNLRPFDRSFLAALVSGPVFEPAESPPAPIATQPARMQPPGMGPAQTPEKGTPGMGPGAAPGMAPGTAPGMAPEAAPPTPAPTAGAGMAVAGINVMGGQSQPWRRASINPDGQWVVITFGEYAQLWDAKTDKYLRLEANVAHASFSPKGTHLALAVGHQALVWDFVNQAQRPTLLQHPTWVDHATFSPDGTRLVTACRDGVARVWDIATSRKVAQSRRQGGPVYEVGFSSDGRRIVSTSYDGTAHVWTARVWDAVTGESLTPPLRHSREIVHAEFSPDGTKLLTASLDGTARVWDLSPTRLFENADDLIRYAELLAGRQTDLKGGEVFLDPATLSKSVQILKRKYPDRFALSREQQVEWHHQEAEACAHEARWGTLSQRRNSPPPALAPLDFENRSRDQSAWWFAAAFHLDHLIKADPVNGSYFRRRARAHMGMAKWDQAVDDCTKAIELRQTDPEIRLYRGWAYAHLGKWDQAVEDFAAAAHQNGDDPSAWLGLSLAHSQLKHWDQAESAYAGASARTKAFLVRGDTRLGDGKKENVFPGDSMTIAFDFIRSRLPIAEILLGPQEAPKPFRRPEPAAPKPKGEALRPANRLVPVPNEEIPSPANRLLQVLLTPSKKAGGKKAEWWVYRAGGLTGFALGKWDLAEVCFRTACELKPGNWHNWYGFVRTPPTWWQDPERTEKAPAPKEKAPAPKPKGGT